MSLSSESGEDPVFAYEEPNSLAQQFDKDSESEAEIPKEEMKMINIDLNVDPEAGNLHTIQAAIDLVQEGEKEQAPIRVNSGLYREKIVIQDKSVRISWKDKNSEVYISGDNGSTIYIDNGNEHVVTLVGLKLSFRGTTPTDPRKDRGFSADSKPNHSHADSMDGSMLSDCFNIYESSKVDEYSDCIIMLKRGRLIMDQCQVNLNLMVKNFENSVTNIAAFEDSILMMTNCEIRGKMDMDCLGMYSDKANIKLEDVTFRDFKNGAIVVNSKPLNRVLMAKCHITFNKTVGLLLMGNNKETFIEECKIERNECPGIYILPANKATIRENTIKINTHGIKIKSADPIILRNKIYDNYKCGIICSSVKCKPLSNPMGFGSGIVPMQLTPKFLENEISNNKEHGIYCLGQSNLASIVDNLIIKNQLCGIKTQTFASPVIKSNKISNNLAQGILLVENSCGTVINNQIIGNEKANVAFGGAESSGTFICKNLISGGRSEGIFVIKSGRAKIHNNKIMENQDGIILADSYPELSSNKICQNRKHGVFILHHSKPFVYNNLIEGNDAAGIYVKSKANLAKVSKNVLRDNGVGIFFERKNNDIDQVRKVNSVEKNVADVVTPNVKCTLI